MLSETAQLKIIISAVYIRVSTDGQMEQSPESQLAEIRKFAAKNGYIIPDEFIFAEQEGISGRTADKRPEFQRMIGVAKSKEKPFDVILVWKFSRFARNRQDSIVYKRMLRKQLGIEVVSVNENIGTDNDGLSELMEAVIEAMDEYYSENLSVEVRRGLMNKAKNGEAITHAPFGYKMMNKKYVVDEERATIVKMIFEDFCVNGMSTYLIAHKLNDMGIKTLSGYNFSRTAIRYIINNPVYIGKIRWNADMMNAPSKWMKNDDMVLVDGIHEAIVPVELWERGQKMEAENRRTHKPKQKTSPARTMLGGLLRCGNCGASMCGGATQAYQCGGYSRGVCKISHSILREKIETLVIDGINSMLAGGEFELAPPPEPPQAKSEAAVIAAQIKKQEQKLERIKEAYEAGVYDVAEMKKRLTNEQSVLDDLLKATAAIAAPDTTKRKKKLMAERVNIVGVLRNSEVAADEKNALLRTFVDKIVFTRRQPRDPGTIDIFLR